MKDVLLFFIVLLAILLVSCSEKKPQVSYIPVQQTTDAYDLDGTEVMVQKNIKMPPRKFFNTATNDTVNILHHLDNTGFHFYNAVTFENEKKGVIVGGSGLKIRTTKDGGLHWQENRFSKFANTFYSVVLKHDTIFAVGESQHIYRSTDFGEKWESFNTNILINAYLKNDQKHQKKYSPRYYKIKFYEQTGIVIGDYDKIRQAKPILLKTTDNGITWETLQANGINASETGISDIVLLSDKTYLIVTFQGNCYKTLDGGKNWQLIFNHTKTSLNSIDFFNEDIGLIGGMNSELWLTQNGGKNWEQIPLKLNKHLNITNIYFVNNQEAVFTIASQNGELKADLLYQVNTLTHLVKSLFSKKDKAVTFKSGAYGLYNNHNNLYILDRHNLYKMKMGEKNI